MKEIIRYQCEICETTYSNKECALDCEAKGVPTRYFDFIGLMYEYRHNDFVGIFAIAKINPTKDKHYDDFSSWAIRTPKFPKYSLGRETCGKPSDRIIKDMSHKIVTREKTESLEFKEMVEYLRGQGITPKYYNEDRELITL